MSTPNSEAGLDRFLQAQDPVYDEVKKELKNGKKRTHWMWFIFPQLKGLGKSSTSDFFGIKGRKEAEDYVNHPVLGRRLKECCEILLNTKESSTPAIFGFPDDLKLKSSMTLFSEISPENAIFGYVLEKFFSGEKDAATLKKLGQ